MKSLNDIRLAQLAGSLYLLLIPMGIFGIMYIPEFVHVAGDAAKTFTNLTDHETVIRFSVLCAFAIQVIQLFLVVALYYLLRPYGAVAALFMLLFTLVSVPIAMLNELSNVAALLIIRSDGLSGLFSSEQIQATALFLLQLHEQGIMIAHIFWGLWLIPMGYLVYRSGFLPKTIGVLLVIAGVGYCVDTLTFFAFATDEYLIAQYTFLGEVLLPITLLWQAFKARRLR
ncbi:MAG: DUF4386 domain-containing protein [Amphritea sp.]|nr:DUF4386 domain-containing protein [Amphritea sp.]MBQ0784045.1 DUF4386 domain-containing protein [Amphritea sp.]